MLWLSLKKGEIKELQASLEKTQKEEGDLSPITTQKKKQLIRSLQELTGVLEDVNATSNPESVEPFTPDFLAELEGLKDSLAKSTDQNNPELTKSIESTAKAVTNLTMKKRTVTQTKNPALSPKPSRTSPTSNPTPNGNMTHVTMEEVLTWSVPDVLKWYQIIISLCFQWEM